MNYHNQRGFSLIEVLVTIVVMAFGFLSLLTLQLATFNNLSATNQSFVAVSLANDMGERIRANRDRFALYSGKSTATFTKNCGTSTCTLVEYDIWQWKQQMLGEQQLPQSVGTVNIIGGVATVNISWHERGIANVDTVKNYAIQVPL